MVVRTNIPREEYCCSIIYNMYIPNWQNQSYDCKRIYCPRDLNGVTRIRCLVLEVTLKRILVTTDDHVFKLTDH